MNRELSRYIAEGQSGVVVTRIRNLMKVFVETSQELVSVSMISMTTSSAFFHHICFISEDQWRTHFKDASIYGLRACFSLLWSLLQTSFF